MPQADEQRSAGQSFAGNVMKYSVATYLGFVITGAALIVKGLLPSEVLGAPVTFMTYTATFMNIGILGLDQALLRFYHEPPAGAAPRQLFAVCTRLSTVFMLALGVVCSAAAAGPLPPGLRLAAGGRVIDQVLNEVFEFFGAEQLGEVRRHHVGFVARGDLGIGVDDHFFDRRRVVVWSQHFIEVRPGDAA